LDALAYAATRANGGLALLRALRPAAKLRKLLAMGIDVAHRH
jgi:hypothetical protein